MSDSNLPPPKVCRKALKELFIHEYIPPPRMLALLTRPYFHFSSSDAFFDEISDTDREDMSVAHERLLAFFEVVLCE